MKEEGKDLEDILAPSETPSRVTQNGTPKTAKLTARTISSLRQIIKEKKIAISYKRYNKKYQKMRDALRKAEDLRERREAGENVTKAQVDLAYDYVVDKYSGTLARKGARLLKNDISKIQLIDSPKRIKIPRILNTLLHKLSMSLAKGTIISEGIAKIKQNHQIKEATKSYIRSSLRDAIFEKPNVKPEDRELREEVNAKVIRDLSLKGKESGVEHRLDTLRGFISQDGSKPLFKGKDSKHSGIDVPPAEPTPSVEKEKIDAKKFYDALNKNKTDAPEEKKDELARIEELKKNATKKKLELSDVGDLDEVVYKLGFAKKAGENVFAEFEGNKLYSCDVDLDKAYLQVYGVTLLNTLSLVKYKELYGVDEKYNDLYIEDLQKNLEKSKKEAILAKEQNFNSKDDAKAYLKECHRDGQNVYVEYDGEKLYSFEAVFGGIIQEHLDRKKAQSDIKEQPKTVETSVVKQETDDNKVSRKRTTQKDEKIQLAKYARSIAELEKAKKGNADPEVIAALDEAIAEQKLEIEKIRNKGLPQPKGKKNENEVEAAPNVKPVSGETNSLEPIVVKDENVAENIPSKKETTTSVTEDKSDAMENVKVTNVPVVRAEQVSNPEALRVTPKEIADFIAAKKAYAEAKELNESLTDLLAQRKEELAKLVSEFNAARESIGQGLQKLNADNAAKKGELADVDVTIANIKSAFK